ncbi:MAG TPA: lamin tail domain-containing protein [Thermoflexales bacterium]|nr:lamin tail domain-containing protein [Thermoflexales bacterium]
MMRGLCAVVMMPGFAVYAPPDPPTLHDKPQQAPQFMQVMQAAADDICAINHVVISEFRTRGPNGGNDEFVELFNVSPVAVDISGWQVWGSNSTGSSLSSRITISSPVMLAPYQHYLLTNRSATAGPYSGSVSGDQTYGSGFADNGGIALKDASGAIVDQVGLSATSAYSEGTTLAPMSANTDQSYERLQGGAQDTNDNAADFGLNPLSSGPQNAASSITSLNCATPTPTQTPTPGDTPTPTPTSTSTPTATPTFTATPLPTPVPMDVCLVGHVVISEFRFRGPNGGNDEFIELLNVSASAVNIGGWKLNASNTSAVTGTRVTISASVVLPPYGHYLIANTTSGGYSGAVMPDQTYGSGIVDAGGIALMDANNMIVDQVGLGTGSAYVEGAALASLGSINADQSYVRWQGGARDTDDNAADFTALSPADPQNAASSITSLNCATPTPTQTLPPTHTPTPTPTATPTFTATPLPTPQSMDVCLVGHVVISEFRFRGPNGGNDEFIELLNVSASAVNIGGWKLNASNTSAVTGTRVTISASVVLPPYGHYLIANTTSGGYSGAVMPDQTYGSGIVDAGGIALMDANNMIVDQVGLGTGSAYVEGAALASLGSINADQSYVRWQGGARDTDDNAADFTALSPADPQNAASSITSLNCATPTPTQTPTPTATPTSTPSPVYPYINELDVDQTGADALEFIELHDGGRGNTPLVGLVLVLFNGSNNSSYRAIDLTNWATSAAGFFVVGGAAVPGASIILPDGALQNGADAVALFKGSASLFPSGTTITTALNSSATLIDAVVYDTGQADNAILLRLLNPGQPQINEDTGGKSEVNSNQRCLGSASPFRNTNQFAQFPPTPNRANACGQTAIELAGFGLAPVSAAKCGNPSGADCVSVWWQTTSEIDTAGYTLLRSIAGREAASVIALFVQADGAGGGLYAWQDSGTLPGATYQYWLQELALDGTVKEYGPVSIAVDGSVIGLP